MLAVFAAGRILQPEGGRRQVIGATTMGAGGALLEKLAVDPRRGLFVDHDLTGTTSSSMPTFRKEVIFMDESDPMSSPMKAKGVGEFGLCGVAAAIANTIHNAKDIPVRHYRITLDKLINGLPMVA